MMIIIIMIIITINTNNNKNHAAIGCLHQSKYSLVSAVGMRSSYPLVRLSTHIFEQAATDEQNFSSPEPDEEATSSYTPSGFSSAF